MDNIDCFEITGVAEYLSTFGNKFFVMEDDNDDGKIVIYPNSQRDPVVLLLRVDKDADRWYVKFCRSD
jgi:hypothetical protein